MARLVVALIYFWSVVLGALAPDAPGYAQANYDRPGGDYANVAVPSGDPADCAMRCERDWRCEAWSFSYPRTATREAVCWLKSTVQQRKEDACCVSGVRGAGVIETRNSAIEFATDRLGGDYRNFEMPASADGGACKAACGGDNKCRAWTYARPGYVGASARCFLKSSVKPPRRKPCCISGAAALSA